uniref:K Homology domain-containing protein n=1 Tax=Salix viminalis TaxID=40686 RepID=A0A6N2K862_SALVM
MIITRLLVPSSKVGCILGQGGQVINEMRRRLQADIRVYPKNDKPKCASDDEELVQISGNYGVAKDALAEIASRLRSRTLRDANAETEPGPVGPVPGVGPARNLPGRGPQPSGMMAASSSGGYEPRRGGRRDYEPQSYPVPPAATGYPSMNRVLEANNSHNGMNSVMRSGGVMFQLLMSLLEEGQSFKNLIMVVPKLRIMDLLSIFLLGKVFIKASWPLVDRT